jgi:putative ABC transport system permease protein
VTGAGAVLALARGTLRAHRARLALSVLAVVLGVAFIGGTLLVTDSLTAGVADLAPRRATATVRAATTLEQETRPALPADLPARLRRLDGVRAAAGKVLGGVQLRPVTGSVRGPSLALSWPQDAALSPLELVTGRRPQGGEAAVSAGFARGDHVKVGDAVQVATGHGTAELRVSGIVRVGGADGAGPASLVVLDLATARELLGVAGWSSVDVLAAPGALTPARLAGLGAGRVESVDPRRAARDDSAGVAGFLEAVAGILRGFGGLALAVGSFLIFNTLSMLAALRTRELGLLRVVGATPRQLGLLVVAEAAMVGVGASLLGVAVGAGAAAGLLAFLAGKDLLPAGLAPRPATLAFAVAAGTVVTVAASLPAAFRAGRAAPLGAMRDAAAPPPLRALAVPLRAGRRLGVSVRLGVENATRNRRRTTATIAALAVGLATVVAAATYTTTWQAASSAALRGSVHADLIVFHATAVGQETTFSPAVAADLRRVRGVRQVVEVRTGRARVGGAVTTVDAVDPATIGQMLRLRLRAGGLAGLRAGTVLVSAAQARRRGLVVGDTVTVELPRTGPHPHRVVGVYDDTPLLHGYLLDLGTYAAGYARQRTLAAYLKVAPGVDLRPPGPQGASPIWSVLRRYQNLGARTGDEWAANLREEASFRGSLLQGLLWFVTLIALLGVANTQALSVVERTREIGLLRAIGMRPRQVGRMVRAETLVVGLLGVAVGLPAGLAAAWLAVRALSDFPGAGLAVPAGGLAGTALVAVLACVLAARAAARRAIRVDVLRAIAAD